MHGGAGRLAATNAEYTGAPGGCQRTLPAPTAPARGDDARRGRRSGGYASPVGGSPSRNGFGSSSSSSEGSRSQPARLSGSSSCSGAASRNGLYSS